MIRKEEEAIFAKIMIILALTVSIRVNAQ